MAANAWVAYLILGVAAVAAVARLTRVIVRVDVDAFCMQVVRLVNAGNVERAIKLCQIGVRAPIIPICAAGLEAFERTRTANAAEREGGEAAERWKAQLSNGRILAVFAVVAPLAIAVMVAVSPPTGTPQTALLVASACIAGLGATALLMERSALVAALGGWRHQVLPALQARAEKGGGAE
jgi:hypothetical protein